MISCKWLGLAGCAALLAAAPARALPVALNVDPVQTGLTARLENLVSDSQGVAVRGMLDAEADFGVDASYGRVATALRLDAATLGFSDVSLATVVPGAIDLSASGVGVGASLSGPTATGTATAPGTSLFDLDGSILVLDDGMLDVVGNVLAAPVAWSADLAVDPLPFVFGPGSVAELVVQELGGDLVALTLTLPIDTSLSLVASDVETTLSLSGDLVLTGDVLIPEPTTGALLGVSLLLLGAARRLRVGP